MALCIEHRDIAWRWGVWHIEESLEELAKMHPCGDRYLKEVRERFSNEKRQLERMAARVLLFELLKEVKEVVYSPTGRPSLELEDEEKPCSVSISHSGEYVAVMISFCGECGIDLEQYGPRVQKVKERFMHPEEGVKVSDEVKKWAKREELSTEVLEGLLHWTTKEALYKMLNRTDVDFREELRLPAFTMYRLGRFNARVFLPAKPRTSLKEGASVAKKVKGQSYPVLYELSKEFVMSWTVVEDPYEEH
jgi:phosphopantetheinyl transferase (holo-ACP synthase)